VSRSELGDGWSLNFLWVEFIDLPFLVCFGNTTYSALKNLFGCDFLFLVVYSLPIFTV